MIVITLTKVPLSLRGDLTKWYQEIQTGVYVGNVSAKIRDLLWDRIMENIGNGEATMVYNTNNELGYQFRTTRKDREVADFDGIPLLIHLNTMPVTTVKHGFSKAAKFHRAKMSSSITPTYKKSSKSPNEITAIDLETTGLDVSHDVIISIGAAKKSNDGTEPEFYQLIHIDREVPKKITLLTKISTDQLTSEGIDLSSALQDLKTFIGDSTLIGYNIRFDEKFLSEGFKKLQQPDLTNKMVDLMPIVKKNNKFLDNYRLATVLQAYHIQNLEPHHALSDAKATLELADKLIKNGLLKI